MPASLTAPQPSSFDTMLEALIPVIEQVQVSPSTGSSIAQSTPPEVIFEIFKPFATRLDVRSSGRTHQFPWYLGQICSTWRSVFLSMHCEFWSEFCLSPDSALQRDTQVTQEMEMRCTAIAKLFLEYGRGRPFSFEIHQGAPSSRLLDIFMRESERWLDVQCTMYTSKIRSLSAIKNRIPLLRTLVLFPIGLNPHKWNAASGCQDVFKNAPRLTRLRTYCLSKWEFNWSSFTVFELTFAMPGDYLFHVLSEMKNLEKLFLDQTTWWQSDPHRMITFPCLKVLANTGYMCLVLLAIEAPKLQELYIDMIGVFQPDPQPWTEFFCTSSFQLKHLGIKTDQEWFMEHLVQFTPEVECLNLVVSPYVRGCQLYDLLANHPDQLPELRELRLYFLDNSEPEFAHLTWLSNIIRSRTSIKCLILTLFPEANPSAPQLMEVKALCVEGGIQLGVECFARGTDWASSIVHGKLVPRHY